MYIYNNDGMPSPESFQQKLHILEDITEQPTVEKSWYWWQ